MFAQELRNYLAASIQGEFIHNLRFIKGTESLFIGYISSIG